MKLAFLFLLLSSTFALGSCGLLMPLNEIAPNSPKTTPPPLEQGLDGMEQDLEGGNK